MSISYIIEGCTLILENGVKRTFKAPIRQVEQLDQIGWFILLSEEFPNNIIALKPDGGLYWRLKSPCGVVFIDSLTIQDESLYCKSREGTPYQLHPQTGMLEKINTH